MILWLVQSTADHPGLADGRVPAGLLSPREEARLASLRTPKRQHDWLLGRWTAKQLVQRYIEQAAGVRIELKAIEIDNNRDGVPVVMLARAAGTEPGIEAEVLSSSLSISHCEEYALCALQPSAFGTGYRSDAPAHDVSHTVDRPRVGADIERIRPRARNFVADYFTPAEITQVDQAVDAAQDARVTAIWSAKEAALKALHLGLSVDTRRVDCRLQITASPSGWQSLDVIYRPYANDAGMAGRWRLSGWWRLLESYVLTVVTTEETSLLLES